MLNKQHKLRQAYEDKPLHCYSDDGPKPAMARRFIDECPICGSDKLNTLKTCSTECAAIKQRKVKRPTKDELLIMVQTMPITHIAKKFGVSNTAVSKWCKKYKI
jgi:predicted nucleic acid-binding Zn ribbon protein